VSPQSSQPVTTEPLHKRVRYLRHGKAPPNVIGPGAVTPAHPLLAGDGVLFMPIVHALSAAPKPEGGTDISTMCGLSRSFFRDVISPLGRLIRLVAPVNRELQRAELR